MFENSKVCCAIEDRTEEIDSNIYMVLIVIGILVIIYLIIGIIFWRFPPSSYHSIDDMLEKLPTSHVERLKSLVVDRYVSDEEEEYLDHENLSDISSEKSEPPKYVKNRKKVKVRIDDHFTEIDNPVYEKSEDEYDADGDDEKDATKKVTIKDDGVEYNLQKEAQKLRRMSKISVSSIKAVSNAHKGVKFADSGDTVLNINDMDNLKAKIFNESQRRASIKPFKKAYNLDVSDSD